jgi:hypothetical protein
MLFHSVFVLNFRQFDRARTNNSEQLPVMQTFPSLPETYQARCVDLPADSDAFPIHKYSH